MTLPELPPDAAGSLPDSGPDYGVVVIGRNEGERLKQCLASIPAGVPVVYVDSGSSDGSDAFALSVGVSLVVLPTQPGFTAARARNAGFAELAAQRPELAFVQFIDGDCTLEAGWLEAAASALRDNAAVAIVFGRRRERAPQASIYNEQCDDEWNVPVGDVDTCGGDAMMRIASFLRIGGYTGDLIAGEEPDLCLRLRPHGFKVRRLDHPMTVHDAAIHRFGMWWKRATRGGHAYFEHVWRHRQASLPGWQKQCLSALVWGVALPGAALACLTLFVLGYDHFIYGTATVVLLFAAQYLRMMARWAGKGRRTAYVLAEPLLLLLSKFAHVAGGVRFARAVLSGRGAKILEYKGD